MSIKKELRRGKAYFLVFSSTNMSSISISSCAGHIAELTTQLVLSPTRRSTVTGGVLRYFQCCFFFFMLLTLQMFFISLKYKTKEISPFVILFQALCKQDQAILRFERVQNLYDVMTFNIQTCWKVLKRITIVHVISLDSLA